MDTDECLGVDDRWAGRRKPHGWCHIGNRVAVPDPTPFESTHWYPIPSNRTHEFELGDALEVRRLGRTPSELPTKVRMTTDKEGRVSFDMGGRTTSLASVVALLIHGPRPGKLIVRHLDDNPDNNLASNIAYGTHADNAADSLRNGTFARGERHGMAKLKVDDVRAIRASAETPTQIARRLKMDPSTIVAIIRRKSWKHVV